MASRSFATPRSLPGKSSAGAAPSEDFAVLLEETLVAARPAGAAAPTGIGIFRTCQRRFARACDASARLTPQARAKILACNSTQWDEVFLYAAMIDIVQFRPSRAEPCKDVKGAQIIRQLQNKGVLLLPAQPDAETTAALTDLRELLNRHLGSLYAEGKTAGQRRNEWRREQLAALHQYLKEAALQSQYSTHQDKISERAPLFAETASGDWTPIPAELSPEDIAALTEAGMDVSTRGRFL